jgi:Uma2 family endonuclease
MAVVQPVRVPHPGRPWTVADLLALSDDENRYELVRGDLLMMSPSSPVQGRFATRFIYALMRYVDETAAGEVFTAEPGFVLRAEPEQVIRASYVAFVCRDRIPPEDQQGGFWPIAPDLAVEIISPSDSASEVHDKVQDYLDAGVRLVWVVYPNTRTVVEYCPPGQSRLYRLDDELVGGDILPGFSFKLHDLFRQE